MADAFIQCTVTTTPSGTESYNVSISATDNCTVDGNVVTVIDTTQEASFSVEFTAADGYTISSITHNKSSDVNVMDDGNNFAVRFNSSDPGSEPTNTIGFVVVTAVVENPVKCYVFAHGSKFNVDISPTDNCTVNSRIVTVTDKTKQASFRVEFTAVSGYRIKSISHTESSDVNVMDDGNNFAVNFNGYDPGAETYNTLEFTVVTVERSGIQINTTSNGTITLATKGKYCNSNIDVNVSVPSGSGGISGGYDVRFSADGQDYSIVSIVAGNAISEPIPPSLSGQVVAGWSTDSAGENLVSFPYTPTANVTLYAKLSAASTVLNDNSWETISAISAAGTGANYWSVGDTKTITLSGTVGSVSMNTSLNVFILGFDHNSAKEGTGISFSGFKTTDATKKDVCLVDGSYGSYSSSATSYTMNPASSSSNSTNSGGWKKAKIRKNILGSTDVENGDATSAATTSPVANTLMAALPADLRAVLKPITKYTDNVGNGSTAASSITPTVDYLPLMAEFEVFGTRSYANTNEQTYQARYQYYKNGKSKVKYKHSDVTTAAGWWLRSPHASYSADFCRVDSAGSASGYASGHSYGLAPAFLV